MAEQAAGVSSRRWRREIGVEIADDARLHRHSSLAATHAANLSIWLRLLGIDGIDSGEHESAPEDDIADSGQPERLARR